MKPVARFCTLVHLEVHHIMKPKRLKGPYLYMNDPWAAGAC